MPRKATGQLILRETGYYGRYWANQDGVRVRVSVALETFNAALAESKLARLVAAASRPERVGARTAHRDLWDRRIVTTAIGMVIAHRSEATVSVQRLA